MILFINACIRKDSRTRRLAQRLLNRLGQYEEVDLTIADLKPLNEETLNQRSESIAKRDYSSPMFDYAKQFAKADIIVIAAPYWDASFPSLLKVYLENIYVTGLVSRYGEDGRPVGLCKANMLYYVTTAGGPYLPNYSYTYLSQLASQCFGIKKSALIKAEMLDVIGFDVEAILQKAEQEIDRLSL